MTDLSDPAAGRATPLPAPSNRRQFLRDAGLAGLGMAALGSPAALAAEADAAGPAAKPASKPTSKPAARPSAKPATRVAKVGQPLVVAVIGSGGRGTEVGSAFAQDPGAVVRYACDVDAARAAAAARAIGRHQDAEVRPADDLRRVLDDKDVAAVLIATPDHWHTPAALLAMAAGKHVYVEKPCSHNPAEGERLVAAARKYDRRVQHGTQRRSFPTVIEAIARVKAGDVGPVRLARGWYNNSRAETGRRTPAAVPPGLNWDLWQGPAPRRPFAENVVPYKWHWFWDWGTGELGNNGVHALDVCRWGLGVDHPTKVTAGGGRYHFADDQETPDTLGVTFDYGDKAIFWEGRSCHPRGFEDSAFGMAFYGERATMVLDGGGYKLFGPKGTDPIEKPVAGPADVAPHVANFLAAIRGEAKLTCEIAEGHKTATMCHLGNIAYRTGRTLTCDPATGRIKGDAEAMKLWGRSYEPAWAPAA